ncbi:tannase/feruloyl esterase family alpha/beta hydrolase [Diaphorobacter caeni]|uniref:tannase/feruloyl esterase family alpha/beta hydrolase n=1 Tax=Diaphorobacter caeni TaxID=2784387 RepID=UPI00188ED942|nr:tannase/feruloyl esterase family alpha/beta hydrolase [Diaphorobacter caeni]MBF5007737.1 tannase/feruloyl esterase family alpha/beta hydrolase [Diaphorobacter caeni]
MTQKLNSIAGLQALGIVGSALLLAACSGSNSHDEEPPQLTEARPGTLASCETLTGYSFTGTRIASAVSKAAGEVSSSVGGVTLSMPAHCLISGNMNSRTGIDGKAYAIGFEMRLPAQWNGRFFHQANGGSGGVITTDSTRAFGQKLGGAPKSNGLMEGYAVLTSDSGHVPDKAYPDDAETGLGISALVFGLDPQARADFGYAAAGALTPMAKGLIAAAYGRGPDRSYMAGCSNGGRLSMVAAYRFANEYDGILAGNPGINLPRAAVAQYWDAQVLMNAAQSTDPVTQRPAIWSALGKGDLTYLNSKIVAKCDALDGATDGMVADVKACQTAFSLDKDVAVCAPGGAADGSCLTATQLGAVKKIFAGPKDSAGKTLYSDWPLTSGLDAPGWRSWKTGTTDGAGKGADKYGQTLARGAVSGAFVFSTPPADPSVLTGLGATLLDSAIHYDFDKAEAAVTGTTTVFSQSPMEFMTPPNPKDLSVLKNRGGKIIVFHGTADPVFSFNDSVAWYEGLKQGNDAGNVQNYARLIAVPDMNHCSGGPATDQFDLLTPLVAWVEKGQTPDNIVATAGTAAQNNGLGNIPAGRTRPLCSYPAVARYSGSGSIDDAANFVCR